MRARVAACCLVVAVSASAASAAPVPKMLGRAGGPDLIMIGIGSTKGLQRVWLYRMGGHNVARAIATVSCGSDHKSIEFRVKAKARREVWQRGRQTNCRVEVYIAAPGMLTVELRGY